MKHSHMVIKNSIWLMVQPLVLNVLSLFVIGYIARTLGQENYGIFNFAFAFVAIFMPFVNMGLGSLATREIAENRTGAPTYIGKLLNLRIFLGMLIYAALIITIQLMQYPLLTKIVIAIAGINILLNALSATFSSAFQGIQRMEYIAGVQFISGLLLTLLSVLVLWLGFGLYSLTAVYIVGSLLSAIIAFYTIRKLVGIKNFGIDLAFWKTNLMKGIPLFIPAFMSIISTKLGIVMLEKLAGPSSVGVFSAANNLTDKILVVPDGICTAIFPTLAVLYQTSRADAASLFRRFFTYLVILGLPIAIGTSIIAKPIILTIYGNEYVDAVFTLQLLAWSLFMSFINSIIGWSVSAIHYEKFNAQVSFIVTAISIPLNLYLIPRYKATGLCITTLILQVLTILILGKLIKTHLSSGSIDYTKYMKILAANAIMFAAVLNFRNNMLISIPLATIVYALMLFALNIVSKSDIAKLAELLMRKKTA